MFTISSTYLEAASIHFIRVLSIGKIEPPATLKRSSNFEIEKLASYAA